MTLPMPEPGMVIRYAYLWAREAQGGREEGRKDRPCAIVLTLSGGAGPTRVVVLPITHVPPNDPRMAIEIPHRTKERLGLDWQRSWIVVTEYNDFVWPGPDLRPTPGQGGQSVLLGSLPPDLLKRAQKLFAANMRLGKAARVLRTE